MATLQYGVASRNAQLDAHETAVGTSPKLRFYTGSLPANCAASATGTLVDEITCPSDWMSAASAGVKALLGSWTAAASAAGTIGYYRIYDSGGTVCHEQGDVSTTLAGTGAMLLDNTNITAGQVVTITAKTLTGGNA